MRCLLRTSYVKYAIKINDGKYFHVYFSFLQTNRRLHNGWTPFCNIFSYICDHVNLSKPKIYTRLVDDIINRRNKNQPDDSFQKHGINSSGKTR